MKIACGSSSDIRQKVLEKLKRLGYKWKNGADLFEFKPLYCIGTITFITNDDSKEVGYIANVFSDDVISAEEFLYPTLVNKNIAYVLMTPDRKMVYGVTTDGQDNFYPVSKCYPSIYRTKKVAHIVASFHQGRLGKDIEIVPVEETIKIAKE